MPAKEKTTLEDFALKSMHLAKMTGVSTAVHAIGDGFLLMHSGVGCKYKTAAQVSQHDWARHPNRREAWTQVGEVSLIRGSGARIGPFARSWYERRRPGFMAVVSAYFIELTGEDIRDLVKVTEKTLPCPMAVISTAAPNKGFFDGYASVMEQVVKSMDFKQPPTRDDAASVLGFFFHRYEPDQTADVAMLKQLIKVGGLTPGPILFSGAPYAELAEAPACRWVLQMPYAYPKRRKFKRALKKRDVIEVDLPMGIGGTNRFLRTICDAVGADRARLDAFIDKKVEDLKPHLGQLAGNFHGMRVAVFADTPLAGGLVTLLRELGAHIAVVGLRDEALGGQTTFLTTLEANGVELNPDAEVLVRPSLRVVRQRVADMVRAEEVHAILGSAIELNAISHTPDPRGALSRVALIETGFPSKDHHTALAVPSIGYTGALVWAQRLLDGILQPRLAVRPLG